MAKSKPQIYVNRFTGDMKNLRKSEAKKLSEDWSKAEAVNDADGKRIGMRIQLNGATVDILENGEREVVPNVNTDSK